MIQDLNLHVWCSIVYYFFLCWILEILSKISIISREILVFITKINSFKNKCTIVRENTLTDITWHLFKVQRLTLRASQSSATQLPEITDISTSIYAWLIHCYTIIANIKKLQNLPLNETFWAQALLFKDLLLCFD